MRTLTCTGGSASQPGFWEWKTYCSLQAFWTSEIAFSAQAVLSSSVQMKSSAVQPRRPMPANPPTAASQSGSRMLPVLKLKQTRTVTVMSPVVGS